MTGHPSSVSGVSGAAEPGPPRLAPGLELIGQYQGSGLRQPIFLARRADGQVVQMTGLLYAVAKQIDGRRSVSEVAVAVSGELGRRLTAEDLQFLLDTKLAPIGIVAGSGPPPVRRPDPLLALRFRAAVVPAGWARAAAAVAAPLFWPPVVMTVLALVAGTDAWLFALHGVAQGIRQVVLVPELAVLALALVVASTAFHELGHAGAARYGGAMPGPIGVGLYLAWPVFYSDVTDSYRLSRGGRLRTDLGGVYFNLVFCVLISAAYLATRFEPLLVVFVLVQIEVLHQFFPFLRLDGYYVASDLIGVPDLFQRIRPTLSSLVPGRRQHPQVADLKPWARIAVAAWVIVTLVAVAALYLLLIFGLPRLIATGAESFEVHAARVVAAGHRGAFAVALLAAVEELFLLLPLAALGVTLARVVRYLGVVGWRLSAGHPTLRFATGVAAALIVGFAAGVMWPSDRYRPIQPTEHGTIAALPGASAVPPSRPLEPAPPVARAAMPPGRTAPTALSGGDAAPAPVASSASAPTPAATTAPAATPVPTTSGSAATPAPTTSPAPVPSATP